MAKLTVPPGLCQMGFIVPIWKSYSPKVPPPLVISEIVPGVQGDDNTSDLRGDLASDNG
jgi:hypothetical protein